MAEPVLKKGSTGQPVRDFQHGLKDLGYDPGAVDGKFGAKTEAAVKAFQGDRGITADGVVGPITWLNLDEADQSEPILKSGSRGLPVRRAQKRMSLAGYDTGGVDGVYGNKTASAVKKLQGNYGLTVDPRWSEHLGEGRRAGRLTGARCDLAGSRAVFLHREGRS